MRRLRQKKESSVSNRKILFLLGCGMIQAFFLCVQIFLPMDSLFKISGVKTFENNWVLCKEDGSEEKIRLPYRFGGKRGETVTVRASLPKNLEKDTALCFYAVHQEMKFYVNGQLRSSYDRDDGLFFTDYPVRAYVPVYLTKEDSGAVFEVQITGWGSNGAGIFYRVYMGNADQLLFGILRELLPKATMAAVLILIAAIALIICIVLGRTLHRRIPMAWLCAVVIMLMVWLLCDSPIRQFVLPNMAAAASVAYQVMLLAPMAFCTYLDLTQKHRYRRSYQIIEGVSLLAFFLCFFLNLLGIDFLDMSSIVYYMLFAMILICGINLVREAIGGYIREYKYVAAGIGITVVCGILEILLLLFQADKTRQLGLCASQLLFIVLAGFQTVSDIRTSIQLEKQRADQSEIARRELAETLSAELLPTMQSMERDVKSLEGFIAQDVSDNLRTGMNQSISALISIRDLSRLSGEADVVQNTCYQLDTFIESAQSFLDVRTKSKDLEGELIVSPDLPKYMTGSLESSRHIFINLVEYAVQHTRKGEIVASISSVKRKEGFDLEISVASSWGELSREFAKKLEDKEQELSLRGDVRLLSVRTMALSQGGRMLVESVDGGGFLITALLPHQEAEGLEEEAGPAWMEKPLKQQEEAKEEPEQPSSLIDRPSGLMYCRGDEALYQEILEAYVAEGRDLVKRLSLYVRDQDWENYRILVHGLKSSSMSIGAKNLSAMAKKQEYAAKEGHIEEILTGWESLAQLYQLVLEEAGKELPKGEEEKGKEGCLEKIKECLEGYDMEAALAEVQRLLKEKSVPEAFLEDLKEAIEDFDYDKAQALVEGQGSFGGGQ